MDIYAKEGDKIVFAHPNWGYPHDQKLARDLLVVGKEYTVEKCDVSSFTTSVYLKEVSGFSFNSVLFDDVTGHYKEPYGDTIDQLRAKNKRLKGINADLLEALKKCRLELSYCSEQLAHFGRKVKHGSIADALMIVNEIIAKCEGK